MKRRSKKLPLTFFKQPADIVARELIGKILVHDLGTEKLRCRIVETEAYMGPDDLASHSSKGVTNRTKIMFGPPGRAYVYFIYGMHEMFNIIVGEAGKAHAVLLRAGEPLDGWHANLTGPGRLAKAMRIDRSHNGKEIIRGPLHFADDGFRPNQIIATPRIGIDYAKHWVERPLRFIDPASKHVSGKRYKPPAV